MAREPGRPRVRRPTRPVPRPVDRPGRRRTALEPTVPALAGRVAALRSRRGRRLRSILRRVRAPARVRGPPRIPVVPRTLRGRRPVGRDRLPPTEGPEGRERRHEPRWRNPRRDPRTLADVRRTLPRARERRLHHPARARQKRRRTETLPRSPRRRNRDRRRARRRTPLRRRLTPPLHRQTPRPRRHPRHLLLSLPGVDARPRIDIRSRQRRRTRRHRTPTTASESSRPPGPGHATRSSHREPRVSPSYESPTRPLALRQAFLPTNTTPPPDSNHARSRSRLRRSPPTPCSPLHSLNRIRSRTRRSQRFTRIARARCPPPEQAASRIRTGSPINAVRPFQRDLY